MAEHHLDARGLICPLPVLKARKKLLSLGKGDVLRVTVDSADSAADFKLFCDEENYSCTMDNDDRIVVVITL